MSGIPNSLPPAHQGGNPTLRALAYGLGFYAGWQVADFYLWKKENPHGTYRDFLQCRADQRALRRAQPRRNPVGAALAFLAAVVLVVYAVAGGPAGGVALLSAVVLFVTGRILAGHRKPPARPNAGNPAARPQPEVGSPEWLQAQVRNLRGPGQ